MDLYRLRKAQIMLERWKQYKAGHDKIRVGFIMQNETIWNKLRPVFEKMSFNNDFEVVGLLIPGFEGYDLGKFEKKRYKYGSEYEYFHKLYKNVVDVIENEKVIDITKLDLDYVFYQRPYDILLPEELRPKNIIKIAKTMYIPYGCTGALNYEKLQLISKTFFSYIYCYYVDTPHMASVFKNDKYYSKLYRRGLVRYPILGYPVFEACIEKKSVPHDKIRILWTPRWSYDEEIGGSHFFEYYRQLIDFQKYRNDIQLIIRPHPLMLDNFIRAGRIDSEWKENFLAELDSAGILFDINEDIDDTFSEIDILITDFSSVISNYAFTSKPMIYCPSDCNLINDVYEEIISANYVAEDWGTIKEYLNKLINGDDRLKNKRLYIKERWDRFYASSTDRIIESLKLDYKSA